MPFRSRLILAIAAVLCGCGTGAPSSPEPRSAREVSVAAAADLRFAFDDIAAAFRRQHPQITVKVTYGSSGNFHAQLLNQAPFDLFLSADVQYPRELATQGLTLPGSDFVYAVGRIVVWVPAGSAIDVAALGMESLRHPTVTKIAIANPQHAPYGRAAEAAMRSFGVYEAAKPKLVFGENIAQAMQFVESGNAQVGIVALALALAPAARDASRFWKVPLDKYPRMEQGGVIMKWARDADAARLLRAFLTESEGGMILRSYGFASPEAAN
jgi:molybdate transport system substrate-binding protein